jgi:hypothetical protein
MSLTFAFQFPNSSSLLVDRCFHGDLFTLILCNRLSKFCDLSFLLRSQLLKVRDLMLLLRDSILKLCVLPSRSQKLGRQFYQELTN